ncbi:MAG: ATP-binding cassette domain-containing protein, partial [bacterium]
MNIPEHSRPGLPAPRGYQRALGSPTDKGGLGTGTNAPQPPIAEESSNGRPIALRVSETSKAFGPTQALDAVSFDLAQGSVHALLGGNGSGKSTLIKILAGVEAADHGWVELQDGERLDLRTMTPGQARAAELHFVHQERTTFPELSISENLALDSDFAAGGPFRISWREARRQAAAILERFEIDAHPDQALGEVSPAKQTMVAIARALQGQEDSSHGILLLDEPTAALPHAEVSLV